MYRRHGHRAILTGKGSLVVAPTWLETALLRTLFTTASVRDHSLSRYYASLAAVLLNQVEARARHEGGAEGLLQLMQDLPLTRVALREHAASKGISLAEQLASTQPVKVPASTQRLQTMRTRIGQFSLRTSHRSHSARAGASSQRTSRSWRASSRNDVYEDGACSSDDSGGGAGGGWCASQRWSRAERLAMLQELGLCDSATDTAAGGMAHSDSTAPPRPNEIVASVVTDARLAAQGAQPGGSTLRAGESARNERDHATRSSVHHS